MLVALGGNDYVMRGNFYVGLDYHDDVLEGFGTILHAAIRWNSSMEVVTNIIEVGRGRDIVWEKDEDECEYGPTALHVACQYNASIDIVKELIKVGGGRDYVWEKNAFDDCTSLHFACANNVVSIDVVKELLEVGEGRDFVLEKDVYYCRTALHVACRNNASIDVVKELIEAGGGRDFVLEKDGRGRTAFHLACHYNASIDVLNLLIEYGGGDILTQGSNQHKTPLQFLITGDWYGDEEEKRAKIEKGSFLINKGIELQIGGEYSFSGLFNNNTNEEEVRDEIYEYWDERVLPTLEQVMTQHRNRQHLPILQALIINKAPPHIIESAVNTFTDSINTRDSFGKLPIDIAVEYGLSWDDGMESIVEAMTLALVSSEQQQQTTTSLNVCLKYGVQWENGTRIVLENSDMEQVLKTPDASTGLYPFMMAAAVTVDGGDYGYDLDTIFNLMKPCPHLVKQF